VSIVRNILIVTPYDRETINVFLTKLHEEIKEFPIEIQSPGLIADMIYKNMDEQNAYSYFTCFLAAIDAYRNMAKQDTVFMTAAPLRFMVGASAKEIEYDEIWLYRENVTSTHEEALSYYETKVGSDLSKFMNLYSTEDATRKFNTFKGLSGAIARELSKEVRGYGDV
jgi:hypothetical protein